MPFNQIVLWAIAIGGLIGGIDKIFANRFGLGIVEKEKPPFFIQGLPVGFIAIPIGDIFGGLTAGFPVMLVLKNIAPITIVSLLLARKCKT